MQELKDQWLWVVDDQLVDALMRNDTLEPGVSKRSVDCTALKEALALASENQTEEALQKVRGAIENGEKTAELWWAKGQLEFELGRWEGAKASYSELLKLTPGHRAAGYNMALCCHRMQRCSRSNLQ